MSASDDLDSLLDSCLNELNNLDIKSDAENKKNLSHKKKISDKNKKDIEDILSILESDSLDQDVFLTSMEALVQILIDGIFFNSTKNHFIL
jgi:hypothetical protein